MEIAIFIVGLVSGALITYLIAALALFELAADSTATEWHEIRQDAIEARREIRELENE